VGDEAAGRQPPFRKRVGESLSLGFGSSVFRVRGQQFTWLVEPS